MRQGNNTGEKEILTERKESTYFNGSFVEVKKILPLPVRATRKKRSLTGKLETVLSQKYCLRM